jgi:hypothetical protein
VGARAAEGWAITQTFPLHQTFLSVAPICLLGGAAAREHFFVRQSGPTMLLEQIVDGLTKQMLQGDIQVHRKLAKFPTYRHGDVHRQLDAVFPRCPWARFAAAPRAQAPVWWRG